MKYNNRILVIDDDREIWKAYKGVLAPEPDQPDSPLVKIRELMSTNSEVQVGEGDSFDVSFASQGKEGFALAQRAVQEDNPFSVAFIDVRMPPGWDGMETSVRIRQIDPHIEIVIVTAYSDRTSSEIAQALGAPGKFLFIRKPFDAEELRQLAVSLTEKWNISRREEEQRNALELVLAASPAAIFTVDRNQKITSWNPAAEKITGYRAEEIIGHTCPIPRIASNFKCRGFCGDCPLQADSSQDITIEDRAGVAKCISLNVTRVEKGPRGNCRMVVAFWDISTLKNTENALRHSESRFRAMVETTSDWVWEIDRDGALIYCSPVAERLFGYGAEELLGKDLFTTLAYKEEDSAEYRKKFEKSLAEAACFQSFEHKCRHRNGEMVVIESSGTPVLGEDGTVHGFRGIDRDISARIESERDRRHLEAQFRQSQKLEALGTLAGGIAHDLNNILTPIIGYSEIANQTTAPDHPLKTSLEIIEKSAKRAAGLIRQILAFTRKQVMEPAPINLSMLINDFSKMLRRLIRVDVKMEFDLAESVWTVSADVSQMEQVLLNLVVNARDAVQEGGKIIVRTRNENITSPVIDSDHATFSGQYVVLSVIDKGVGIDEETLKMIFDPFFTTKDIGRGTGMGLATVHGIVRQHDGHIRVETTPGRGTAFHIYLPRVDNKEIKTEEKLPILELPKGDETILVVEDDRTVLQMIEKSLKDLGYTVLTAVNGKDALNRLKKQSDDIDLVLTDLVMPEMGGWALATGIEEVRSGLPVMFMTGFAFDQEFHGLAVQQGMTVLQKPFHTQDLARMVRQCLDT